MTSSRGSRRKSTSWSAARAATGRIGSVMLGDASTGVLRKAQCPVLVVPRGARGGFAALRAPAVEPV